jgi:hypothetical protein
MSIFREVRQAIRNLKPYQYWGIQKGCNIEPNGTRKRRFFIMHKYPMQGAVTVYEKWFEGCGKRFITRNLRTYYRMGHRMQGAMLFCNTYKGWHSFDQHCRTTTDAIKRLAKRGLVEINQYGQFRKAV